MVRAARSRAAPATHRATSSNNPAQNAGTREPGTHDRHKDPTPAAMARTALRQPNGLRLAHWFEA
eukprot:6614535-Prymnesium_polylepis.1